MPRKTSEDLQRTLLSTLINGARRSDRDLAKILKISQPTVTRRRKLLEKAGMIQEYTAIPDFTKMGYDFVAMTFLTFAEDSPEFLDKEREWAKGKSSVIYVTKGEGMGMSCFIISIHRNYASYSKLITELKRDWQPTLTNVQTFMASLARPELLIKPLSFRYLESNNSEV
ncbi:MAG TPA: Lrp/AsnC family transcriptional regulator [Candidatus Bathyarchaeia archaeon]|nr:Lrp/AsnC family transcriptional regulator [Candidatus Bathyarchaeia archaeon]